MRLKVAAILFVALSLLLVEESHGWKKIKRIFRRVGKIIRKGVSIYKKVRKNPLGHIAIEAGKKYLRPFWNNKEEISKLRELREKDEEAYKNAMSMIANEIATESGDGEAQIMMEMLDELASMPDEEFNQFMTEQELEQIADSDELLLSHQ
uniref:uncharacterized protein LOC120339777 n=1 Tax=Styela clava TaxID=7725 RepID=UPI00193A6538|nr:uncharacterized protein LOC120339777 [Styela clava]